VYITKNDLRQHTHHNFHFNYFQNNQIKMWSELKQQEVKLIEECFQGLDPTRILDSHFHVLGLGTNESGCYINSKMNRPLRHPLHWAKKKVFLAAAGIDESSQNADQEYAQKIALLQEGCSPYNQGPHGKAMLLAFDQCYNENGVALKEQSGFYIPNEWVWKLVQDRPNTFCMACSVHPYRTDALVELEKWAQLGVCVVKWLPNSQGINPTHPKCAPFYDKMKEFNMILLSHCGFERSVDQGYHDDKLGNPLLLKAPLDAGVRVIAAHLGSEGVECLCGSTHESAYENEKTRLAAASNDEEKKIDHGHDHDDDKPRKVSSFDLVLQLMDDEKYNDLLFGDISATLTLKRAHTLSTILDRQDLHHRFLFGTDFPVCAVGFITWTSQLIHLGLITKQQGTSLNIIYKFNPLLYDFLAKRCLRSAKGNRLQDCIFQQHSIFQ
jgi:predicted TIM-barrel fold metal-dependent hydrolase